MPDPGLEPSDLTGQSLGPYTITERIGRGGMAEVYKALHRDLAVHRAIKVIRPEFVTAVDFRARFQKEAQAVAQLRHPNIVQLHDFGTHGNAYYMVMEYIEGRDLKRVVTEEGPIRPVVRAVTLTDQVAAALEYAHGRGIIHRDIKSENVMLTLAGQPILTDFGIAKLAASSTQLTQTGFGIGTPAYMPPEQAQGVAELGPPADIYALTIVLYELLTQRLPFSADTPIGVILKSINDPLPLPRAMRGDISEALQAVILKGTQKRPQDRFATVAEFRRALTAAAQDAEATGDSHATTTSIWTQTATAEPASRRGIAPLLGGLGAAAIVVGGAGWYLLRETPSNIDAAPAAEQPGLATAAPVQPDPLAGAPVNVPDIPRAMETPVEAPRGEPAPAPRQIDTRPAPPPDRPDAAPTKVVQAELAPTASASLAEPAAAAMATRSPPVTGPLAPAPSGTTGNEVTRGVTTQRDLLRLFGGPNLVTTNEAGLETWIYERTITQTDSSTTSQGAASGVDFNAFFKVIGGGASASKERSADTSSTRSSIRTVTVIVTFAANRTVSDYTVRESYY